VDWALDEPNMLGNIRSSPARRAGRQVHIIAVVVSNVVQKVVGTLSHVGSAVKPKSLRVVRRTIEHTQTL
jgi:hypothetical protein